MKDKMIKGLKASLLFIAAFSMFSLTHSKSFAEEFIIPDELVWVDNNILVEAEINNSRQNSRKNRYNCETVCKNHLLPSERDSNYLFTKRRFYPVESDFFFKVCAFNHDGRGRRPGYNYNRGRNSKCEKNVAKGLTI